MLSLRRLIKSFYWAGKGLWTILREEQNFQIQFIIGIIVLFLAIFLKITFSQIIILILVITMVLVLELINSIFERLVDMLKPRLHHYVKDIKNIMAATVLIASVAGTIIGILIFWPYIF